MGGEEQTDLGFKSPSEIALDTLADKIGFGPAQFAKQLFSQLSPPSGTTSGKFEFSVEEMKGLLQEFETEREAFRAIRARNDRNVYQLRPTANDPASNMHYKAARDHYGVTFAQAIEDQFKYCHAYCEAIKLAIDKKELGEEAAVEAMSKREGTL